MCKIIRAELWRIPKRNSTDGYWRYTEVHHLEDVNEDVLSDIK